MRVLPSNVGFGTLPLGRNRRAIEGVAQLIIVRLADAPGRDHRLAPEGKVAFSLRVERVEEQPVVAVFVRRDASGDFLQNGFFRCIADRRVVGRRAAFDYASGDHLAPPAPPDRYLLGRTQMPRLVALPKSCKGLVESELRVCQFRPAAECATVLAFFAAPLFDSRECRWIGAFEDALEVGDVVRRVEFHQSSSLHGGEQARFNFGPVEFRPVDIVQSPALRVDGPCRHSRRTPISPLGTRTGYTKTGCLVEPKE